jgi:hypothetical protein
MRAKSGRTNKLFCALLFVVFVIEDRPDIEIVQL